MNKTEEQFTDLVIQQMDEKYELLQKKCEWLEKKYLHEKSEVKILRKLLNMKKQVEQEHEKEKRKEEREND